jgi:hypothetical protein
MLSSELLWFTLLSYISQIAFLTLYFSHTISDYSSKPSPRNDAFLLSFLGSSVGSAFSLAIPFLPSIVPYMDVAIGLVVVTWILLLHYHFGASWLEAALITAIAAIIYVVILAMTFGFYILWLRIS